MMSAEASNPDDDDDHSLVDEILRELNDLPLIGAPRDRNCDSLPFDPTRVSLRTLLRQGHEYRNHEPLLAQVIQEIQTRDFSSHATEVRALQARWRHLARVSQPLRWPDTATKDEEQAFRGVCFHGGEHGMLAFFGYHVGNSRGLIQPARRRILDYVYKGRLPIVNDEKYTRSWGEPATPERLRKLSSTLAHLARNALARENHDMEAAISEWNADLLYLKGQYFRPYDNPDHDWHWPTIQNY